MEKTKIFAPFHVEKIVEDFEGYWISILSVAGMLMILITISNAVFGFPWLMFPWRDVLFIDLFMLFSMGIILLPLLYWQNEEYKGKRFRRALTEATFLNWFWTLMLIPAGLVNILKLITISSKAIYRTLKKPIIRQTIRKLIVSFISFLRKAIKESIPFILNEIFKEIKKAVKAPFTWLRKIWKLWKENPILNRNGK